MRTLVTLAIFLVVGFIGSRGYVSRATHRLPLTGLFASGLEFLLLGAIAGPHALDLISQNVINDLEPMVYLALGWIGLLFGIEMAFDQVRQVSRSLFRFLFVDTVASLVFFSAAMFFLVDFAFPGMALNDRIVWSVLLGITASFSSPTIVALATQRLPSRGPLTNTMRIASALSPLFPLIAFGLLFMLVHPRFFAFEGIGSGLLWWVFVNAGGLVLGMLMVLFTHEKATDDEMLLVILGTVFIVGGVCYFLQISALYTGMVMGVVVGNLSRRRDQIFRELHYVEKPIFFGFLIVVGAMAAPPDGRTLLLVVAYVVLRWGMKHQVTGAVAVAGLPDLRQYGRRVGLVLSGQGMMAVAIVLDANLASTDYELSGVLTVVALAVVINDTVGYLLARRTLIASGEASPRAPGRKQGGAG